MAMSKCKDYVLKVKNPSFGGAHGSTVS